MAGNVFGDLFRISTFGESHGGAVGVIVEGITPGLPISEEEVQKQLDRRKPGQSEITTPRKETDTVHIMSGWFEGKATGTPLMMIIYNKDQQPEAYDEIKNLFRPGHADYTYMKKYGIRDFRGSGRASGRETAGRVAAGAIARKQLEQRGVTIQAYTQALGGISCTKYMPEVIEQNDARACDPDAAKAMIARILKMKEENNSVGGIIECRIQGMKPGIGDPVFDKLDAELAKAMLSIGATKGIEFGTGFAAAELTGKEHNDEMTPDGFLSNHAGGIIGGISTGEEIIFRVAVKPTSSIATPQQTVDLKNEKAICITEGRHDPCICPRIVPVIEAMTALVLEDQYKRQAAMLG